MQLDIWLLIMLDSVLLTYAHGCGFSILHLLTVGNCLQACAPWAIRAQNLEPGFDNFCRLPDGRGASRGSGKCGIYVHATEPGWLEAPPEKDALRPIAPGPTGGSNPRFSLVTPSQH